MTADEVSAWLTQPPSAEVDGKYLHWDELRHRDPPPKLSRKTWWFRVVAARAAMRREIPLADQQGHPFWFALSDSVLRLVHEIDRSASGRIELPEDITNNATRDRYIVSSLIEEAITSSQLEGASTTRKVAKDMLRSGRPPRDRDEQMIFNNYRAMEWVRAHLDKPLTPAAVLALHRVVTEDSLESGPDGAGRFRTPEEKIHVVDMTDGEVMHTPPSAETLPARVAAMCDFANGKPTEPFVPPVVRAILVHLWLAYDHPFVDGNGRTARALFYWVMLREGYWLTEFLSISRVIKKARAQYDRAFLYTETDSNDATYFVLHQLRVIRQAIDDVFEYLRRKTAEVRDVESRLRRRDDLNHRQAAVLAHAVRRADAIYTIKAHQLSHRVSDETARADLVGLVRLGLLTRRKKGKGFVFEPARDLDRKLRP